MVNLGRQEPLILAKDTTLRQRVKGQGRPIFMEVEISTTIFLLRIKGILHLLPFMKLSREEIEIYEDAKADKEFEKSRERFLNQGIIVEDKVIDPKREKYLKELNERHNQRLKKHNGYF